MSAGNTKKIPRRLRKCFAHFQLPSRVANRCFLIHWERCRNWIRAHQHSLKNSWCIPCRSFSSILTCSGGSFLKLKKNKILFVCVCVCVFLINSCACFARSKVLPFLFPCLLVFWFPLHQLCFFLCWRMRSYGSVKVLVLWSGNTVRIVSLRFHRQSGDEFVFFCSCEFFAPSVRVCVSYGIEWWLAFVMISLHCCFELVLLHLAISSVVKLRCEVCQGYIHTYPCE